MSVPHDDNDDNATNMMIRHSGRAHIRGKIRRVWRPRFLELDDSGLVRYYETTEEHLHDPFPKSTLQIHYARIIDVTTFRDLHVGLPKGTFGFLFHARRFWREAAAASCHAPPEHKVAPRDFLCAVSTLEEAQSWVVALQWAASLNETEWNRVDYQDDDNDDEEEEDYYHLFHKKRNALVEVVPPPKKRKKPTVAKIVVTKVRQYRFVRTTHDGSIHVAYNVQVLLLRTVRGKRFNVEERTVARTKDDLLQLLQLLEEEHVGRDKVLQQAKDILHHQLYKNTPVEQMSELQIRESVELVDSAMRVLAMEGVICNSRAMRRFWCISSSSSSTRDGSCMAARPSKRPVWPPWHDPEALLHKRSLTPSTKNPDDFVKQWLQYEEEGGHTVVRLQWYMVWILRRPPVLVALVAVSLVIFYPLLQAYQGIVTSITTRLDVLILSWMISLGAGREWGKRDALKQEAPITIKKAVPPPPPKPLPPSEPSQFEEEASLLDEHAEENESLVDSGHSTTTDEEDYMETTTKDGLSSEESKQQELSTLSSPLPQHPSNGGVSCWSKPEPRIFRVRGATYLTDRIKVPSAPEPFVCRGVDVWLTDNPERHIARHPSVLGGKLGEDDSFVVNFLLPFGNFVAYFAIPPLEKFPSNLRSVWTKFLKGDQQYRDARLKLLPVVVDGPWIVRKAVGPGTAPALLGKVIPLQYYFSGPTDTKKGVYEVDIIITASRIAKGILSVVKGNTNALTIAFAFIIEGAEEVELPETVLCTFQMHSLHLESCPQLPECNLDEIQ